MQLVSKPQDCQIYGGPAGPYWMKGCQKLPSIRVVTGGLLGLHMLFSQVLWLSVAGVLLQLWFVFFHCSLALSVREPPHLHGAGKFGRGMAFYPLQCLFLQQLKSFITVYRNSMIILWPVGFMHLLNVTQHISK